VTSPLLLRKEIIMAQVLIAFNPQDKYLLALGNTLAVVTTRGNVFGHEVVGRTLGPAFPFSGTLFPMSLPIPPVDRFTVVMGNRIITSHKDGNIGFQSFDVAGRRINPGFMFTGAKVGFNPNDRFMAVLGNRLVVTTNEGNVFGHDVAFGLGDFESGHIFPAFPFGGAKVASNPQDRWLLALGNRLLVVTREGNVFAHDVVGRDIRPAFPFGGAKIGFNPNDRFMAVLGNRLVVTTNEGNAFATDVVISEDEQVRPTIQEGSSGEDVEVLQRALLRAGFDPGPVDGEFGPVTTAAVRKFQAARGLVVDGVVGPQTWSALGEGGGIGSSGTLGPVFQLNEPT
jgi:hypothetical protein